MAFYQFIKTQKLPVSVSEIWDFISSPGNLKDITPEDMDFTVTSNNSNEKMYAGMIITYKVKPLMGIKMNWMTEITHVRDYEYFVDEQRIGPYSLWHHQHKIEPIEGGVLMTDIVTYQPPFGLIGALINSLTIRNKLRDIFIYREMALEKRFGKLHL
jgi:ligand-binding SRPBCC domain-containing protein